MERTNTKISSGTEKPNKKISSKTANQGGKMKTSHKMKKSIFPLKSGYINTNHGGHRIPSLIFDWNKNKFLTHLYSRKYEIKLGSGKEPQPSRVLYIGPSKRLND
jgi:hypothetical protein